jgi:hypothetical protein
MNQYPVERTVSWLPYQFDSVYSPHGFSKAIATLAGVALLIGVGLSLGLLDNRRFVDPMRGPPMNVQPDPRWGR